MAYVIVYNDVVIWWLRNRVYTKMSYGKGCWCDGLHVSNFNLNVVPVRHLQILSKEIDVVVLVVFVLCYGIVGWIYCN